MAVQHDGSLIGMELGHCRIERKLGAGGMGAVYLAHHTGLNKPVAIKVLPPELASNGEFIDRFQREARLAARLEHPHVVQVYDVGSEQGVHYITMQYIEGRSLDAIQKEKKKFSVSESLAIARRVALALAAAHKLGIVHRDIKPANILLSKDGMIKVADFGLAKDAESNRTLSGTGQIVGTPYYMSPEQAQGLAVDARSDLYSLGATLYHLITGQKPFDAPTPISIVLKHVQETPVPPRQIDPAIPEAVSALILRTLAKNPADRPATAEDLFRELEALKGPAPSTVRATIPVAEAHPPRWGLRIALGAAGVAVLGILLGSVLGKGDPKPAGPVPVVGPASPAALPQAPQAVPPVPAGTKPPEKPVPVAEDLRQKILAKVKDAQEKRLTEELMGKTDDFLKALQKKDLKAIRGMLDHLTLGDPTDTQLTELFPRLLGDKTEIQKWEFEDIQVRPRGMAGRASGFCQMTYWVRFPKGEMKLTDQPLHWTRKPDGWSVTRPPRTGDK